MTLTSTLFIWAVRIEQVGLITNRISCNQGLVNVSQNILTIGRHRDGARKGVVCFMLNIDLCLATEIATSTSLTLRNNLAEQALN